MTGFNGRLSKAVGKLNMKTLQIIVLLICTNIALCQEHYVLSFSRDTDSGTEIIKFKNKIDSTISEITFKKLTRRQVKLASFSSRTRFMGIISIKRIDQDQFRKNLKISERIKDSIVQITEVFEVLYSKMDTNVQYFIDCDPLPCPYYCVTKYVANKTDWKYCFPDYFNSKYNLDDLRHWYELYCLNIKKHSRNSAIKQNFSDIRFFELTLKYWE